ncbi:MAG: hypothetical protein RML40_11660, partial [Bacteroidota bacterium]|nr:hypothetical protein [Candidatus Kapabacteria bacterium]MDW8221173.1 hypothetical protein [Bacteroidota bacterium]
MQSYRFLSLWAASIVVIGSSMQPAFPQHNPSTARKPCVSFSIERPGDALPFLEKNSTLASSDSVPALFLRERVVSLFRRDTAFQRGSVAINRIGGSIDDLLVVAYAIEYFDANGRPLPNTSTMTMPLPVPLPPGAIVTPEFPTPSQVAINTLQGDLSPTNADANGILRPINVATRTIPNTANILPGQRNTLLNFVARWSDQSLEPRNPGLQGRRFVLLTLLRVNDLSYELGVTL